MREREAVGKETEKLEETGDQSWFFSKRVSGWKDIIPKDPRKELEGRGRGKGKWRLRMFEIGCINNITRSLR